MGTLGDEVLQERGPTIVTAGPALLLAGAVVPELRPAVALLLLGGWALLRAEGRPEAIAWAAVLPVAVILTWPWLLGGDLPLGDPGCRDPLSTIAMKRLAVAAVGLLIVAGLARSHRSGRGELGLLRPRPAEAAAALGSALVVALGGLWVGPALARPFFGKLDFPWPLAAVVPAVAFGVANGVLEEVCYRGAMQAWLCRVMPVALAVGIQGLVFGIVHAGPDVLALLPAHIAVMATLGVAGGVARLRLGSLWVPIGVHVGADIALYVGLACRVAG